MTSAFALLCVFGLILAAYYFAPFLAVGLFAWIWFLMPAPGPAQPLHADLEPRQPPRASATMVHRPKSAKPAKPAREAKAPCYDGLGKPVKPAPNDCITDAPTKLE
jgi:hypothetical protein